MDRLEATDFAPGGGSVADAPLSLEAWLEAEQPDTATVVLRTDEDVEEHYSALIRQPRLIIEFAAFTDGRGFSHARKLRQLGFDGKLLASGDVLSDQLEFLRSCGFDEILGTAGGGAPEFPGFTVRYQAH